MKRVILCAALIGLVGVVSGVPNRQSSPSIGSSHIPFGHNEKKSTRHIGSRDQATLADLLAFVQAHRQGLILGDSACAITILHRGKPALQSDLTASFKVEQPFVGPLTVRRVDKGATSNEEYLDLTAIDLCGLAKILGPRTWWNYLCGTGAYSQVIRLVGFSALHTLQSVTVEQNDAGIIATFG